MENFKVAVNDLLEFDTFISRLQALTKLVGATKVSALELDPPYDNQGGGGVSFSLNGEMYEFSFTVWDEELMNQNVDGTPTIQVVGLDSCYNGNIACCTSWEELAAELQKL
jgi:hypothetical protein